MNVKSIERKGNEATVVVEIDKELMESGVNKAYMKARKSIQLPGFRKGKAPRKMIEAMYGAHVFYEEGLDEIFPEIYDFAIAKQEFKAIGRPNLTDMQIGDDNIVTLTLTTEVYPEVTLGQYKGLEVEKEEVNVTDEQVQAELDRMAQNVASTETVERPAKMGDTANIDFEGFDNGVPFEGGKGDNFDLKLGSGQFVPGFEEQIVGMSAGEEKDIDVTFPADYHAEELAGKPVVFKVKVHEVKETVVPEKDDEFVKDVSEFDTVAELRADIEKRIRDEKQAGIDRAFENAAVEKAAANMTVEIPDSMIDEELDQEMERMDYELRSQGASLQAYAQMMGGDMNAIRNSLRPSAQAAVRTNVLLDAVAAAENIEVSEEECEEEYKKLAESYKMELDDVKKALNADGLKSDLKLRKAARLIADSAVAVAPKAPEAAEEAPASEE